ncbi:UDP-glucuronosyltransferase 1-5-like [Melanaphis sacchari]|uniref:UDP-glucuronosyltransferase 1-5-like n=1 Tax=Melanaphis sacchari TaxID=742174 RepID=UPI000DC14D56|nr:UDP-glucuronosyltransferase 1-5-like [Melanaphis sacchari]
MRSGVIRSAILGSLLWSIGCLSTISAYRILACEPSPGHSHWNVMSAVLESLVAAGHEVVCLTLHPATDLLVTHPNYTHVDMSSSLGDGQLQASRNMEYAQVMRIFRSNTFMVGLATSRARYVCKHLSDMPEMHGILNSGDKFDVVIMESLHSECMSALPDSLGLPAVYVVPSSMVNWMPMATGSPDHPSYLGTLLTDRPTPETFGQRLVNALVYAHTILVRWYNDAGRDHRWPEHRHTMMFVNTHLSIEPGRPMGPNVLEIGGIHLNRPLKPLPKHLEDVMNNSNEFGVIVLTFGSLVAMDTLPDYVLKAFKTVLSKLPQTIIWKYEDDHMPDKPENVILCKWLPQRAILQHPNVKLFISHGGMSGVYEVVDAGVPVLGIPLFCDQPRNIQNLVNLGMALSIEINSLTRTTLSEAINRLIKDQSFSENAKRVSSLFRDRPMTPSESIVYWVEYLIRHGTEVNIQPLSADASWTSHFMLDICAALAAALLTLWFVTRAIVNVNKSIPCTVK